MVGDTVGVYVGDEIGAGVGASMHEHAPEGDTYPDGQRAQKVKSVPSTYGEKVFAGHEIHSFCDELK